MLVSLRSMRDAGGMPPLPGEVARIVWFVKLFSVSTLLWTTDNFTSVVESGAGWRVRY